MDTSIQETHLRRVRRIWMRPGVPRELGRANARKWVRAMRILGDRWLFAVPVQRKDARDV